MELDHQMLDEIALLARVIIAADRHASPGALHRQELDVALGVTRSVIDLREDSALTEAPIPPNR